MILEQNLFYLLLLETQQGPIEKQQLNSLRLQITGSIYQDDKTELIKILKNRIVQAFWEDEDKFSTPISFATDAKISNVINPNLKNKTLTFHFTKNNNELTIESVLRDNVQLILQPIKISL